MASRLHLPFKSWDHVQKTPFRDLTKWNASSRDSRAANANSSQNTTAASPLSCLVRVFHQCWGFLFFFACFVLIRITTSCHSASTGAGILSLSVFLLLPGSGLVIDSRQVLVGGRGAPWDSVE